MKIFDLIGRQEALFEHDLSQNERDLSEIVNKSKFLVIGGAGTIGQSVAREIFKRNPKTLHIVDISENNMVELVRDIRSTIGYIDGEFKTFAIDCASREFEVLVETEGPYDYVFNLSALKHVRSEKDHYTLMRLIQVNVFNTVNTIKLTSSKPLKKYFCVSTDKAANPVNLMGASKRIMELFAMRESLSQDISMARFANVAFSDGSLLHGFNQRFNKLQPISAPMDVRRYFLTPQESGELCLMSGLLGENRDIFFPKLSEQLHQISFDEIAIRYLSARGFEPVVCESEEEARGKVEELVKIQKWPCYFFDSDTTGEKEFEEFYTESETLDMQSFKGVGIIKNEPVFDGDALDGFQNQIKTLLQDGNWTKGKLVKQYMSLLPNLMHQELGKYLDDRM